MLFNQNDNNQNMIHLGNYEEFFVLYMDNELSDEQMKMVDDFLIKHPDLQVEFDILASTKLPAEQVSINKEDLLADSMKLNVFDEELLLFIDNELPAEQKKIVALELENNKDYRLQHQVLINTKLDASEVIAYPNKKELYRKSDSGVVFFKPWMRIAAAVLLIAALGITYFRNNNSASVDPIPNIAVNNDNKPVIKEITKEKDKSEDILQDIQPVKENMIARNEEVKEKKTYKKDNREIINQAPDQNLVAHNDVSVNLPQQKPMESINISQPAISMGSIDISRDNSILNNLAVTSDHTTAYNNTNASAVIADDAKGNETKGSVKGFLRRATRLIEKRTGIDATTDGELLIGVVAVKLK
jgi:hypothetical protein